MSKFFAVFLLLFSGCINSKSWNHLLAQKEYLQFSPEFPSIESPVLVGNKLVFKGLSYQNFGLWSYDTQTNELATLIEPKANNIIRNLLVDDGKVYFLFRETEYGYDNIWKSDGTLSGTVQFSNEQIIGNYGVYQPGLVLEKNILLARGSNGIIFEFSNSEVTSHNYELYDVHLDNLCVFGQNNFITRDYFEENRIVHITESGLSDLSEILPERLRVNNMVVIDEECYIQFTDGYENNSPFDILKVSPSGETMLFSDEEDLTNIYQVFEYNNQKYAFQKNRDEDNSSSIVLLTQDNEIVTTLFTLTGGSFSEFVSTKGQLQVRFDDSRTGEYYHYYLDAENRFIPIRSSRYLKLPKHYPSLNSDTLVLTEEEFPGKIEIQSIDKGGQLTTLNSEGFDFIDAISSKFSDDVFYLLRDRESGVKSFYSLNEKPFIGAPLSGIWHHPNLKNQGLFIRQGNRHYGSPYVFATMYTFRNGQPLWVAGNADYSPGQAKIEIDLFDFQGSNFFELFEETTKVEFGTITITPTACNTLQARLIHSGLIYQFSLRRINNFNYEKYCLKTQSVTK